MFRAGLSLAGAVRRSARAPSPGPHDLATRWTHRLGLAFLGGALALTLAATWVVERGGDAQTLQAMLAAAQPGDTVVVSPGRYEGSFTVPAGVMLVGAGAGSATLDGGGAERTVGLQRGAGIRGFTITGGLRGIEGLGANQVTDNVVEENGPSSSGAGMFLLGCGAVITTNVIRGNSATLRGGGAYLFLAPTTTCEAGDEAPQVSNNLFVDNDAAQGSGLAVRDSGSPPWDQRWPVMTHNTLAGNPSAPQGGTIFLFSDSAVYDLPTPSGVITSNVISGNPGGGIAQYIYGGMPGYTYGPQIRDNLLFRNGPPVLQAPATGIGMHGNLQADPLFVDEAAGDYRLQPGSPAVDTGEEMPDMDLAGRPRPMDGDLDGASVSDRGALEESGEAGPIQMAQGATVSWPLRDGALAYHLYRGSLTHLLAGGPYTQSEEDSPWAMQWCFLTGSELVDDTLPPPHEPLYYLVTPVTAVEGSLGFDSSRQERPLTNACP